MPTDQLLIMGGRVIDPARGFDERADVLIAGDRITAISTQPGQLSGRSDAQRIDAEGCIVAPGLLDIHVHFREPSDVHDETIASGSAAAVAGGFTTVCCMPNTTPPLDTPQSVRFVEEQARATDLARVFVIACATAGRAGARLADIAALAEAGAVGISDDGDCVADAELMAAALRAAYRSNLCFMQHCQDPATTRGAAMNAGALADRLGLIGWPPAAEVSIIERDIALNRPIGARYHAQHVSCGDSVQLIRTARAAGEPVSGEASPHHLLLTEEACAELDTNAKMNPPLRTSRDVEQLRQGVADGTITVLATDHAPHSWATKSKPFATASFGIVGLECALPLYIQALVDSGAVDWPRLIALMTIEPARLVGLDRRGFGHLVADGPADVTIIDPDERWIIDASAFASAGRNCPFDGWEVTGRAVGTIVGGRLHYEAPGAVRHLPLR